jgi:hypothetical protein
VVFVILDAAKDLHRYPFAFLYLMLAFHCYLGNLGMNSVLGFSCEQWSLQPWRPVSVEHARCKSIYAVGANL